MITKGLKWQCRQCRLDDIDKDVVNDCDGADDNYYHDCDGNGDEMEMKMTMEMESWRRKAHGK